MICTISLESYTSYVLDNPSMVLVPLFITSVELGLGTKTAIEPQVFSLLLFPTWAVHGTLLIYKVVLILNLENLLLGFRAA